MCKRPHVLLIGALLAAGCHLPGVAHTSLYCEIVATKDGFAAVRSGPSRSASIVRRYPPGELILLDETRRPPAHAKDWQAVSIEAAGTGRIVARGWMHRSLIKRDSCG
jgi:hypothetical protein